MYVIEAAEVGGKLSARAEASGANFIYSGRRDSKLLQARSTISPPLTF